MTAAARRREEDEERETEEKVRARFFRHNASLLGVVPRVVISPRSPFLRNTHAFTGATRRDGSINGLRERRENCSFASGAERKRAVPRTRVVIFFLRNDRGVARRHFCESRRGERRFLR